MMMVFFERVGEHPDLHVLTLSFPTRRSSDLPGRGVDGHRGYSRRIELADGQALATHFFRQERQCRLHPVLDVDDCLVGTEADSKTRDQLHIAVRCRGGAQIDHAFRPIDLLFQRRGNGLRSEEHTSELQSLMRISYAVFCLKKNKLTTTHPHK